MAERIHRWTDRWLRSLLFLSFCFFLWLPTHLSIYVSISLYLSICLSVYLSIYLSVYLSICKLENEAILRDFLNFWTCQHQKRSNSGRVPQFFEFDNVKNEAILRDFLSSDEHVSCTAPATENASLQILFKYVPRLPSFLEILQNPDALLTFKVHNPLRLAHETTTSERPKVVRTPGAFNMLTSKCASGHNGVHFFDISISKSGPRMVCF